MDKTPPGSQPKGRGLTPIDIMRNLPDEQRSLVNWLMRQGHSTLADIIAHCDQDEKQAHQLLEPLLEQGYIREEAKEESIHYRVQLPPKRPRKIPSKLMKALSKKKKPSDPQNSEMDPG